MCKEGVAGNVISYSIYCNTHRQADPGTAVFKPRILPSHKHPSPSSNINLFVQKLLSNDLTDCLSKGRHSGFFVCSSDFRYLPLSDSQWFQQQTNPS